jgi:L-ascorbate metabolism protein UlaG (beta-lactamase superfamily)
MYRYIYIYNVHVDLVKREDAFQYFKGKTHTFYYSGDTGYCPVFKQIGDKFGPMDLSANVNIHTKLFRNCILV